MLFWSTAYAQQAAAPAATGGAPALWEQALPMVVIFAVLYFLIIRPQSKARRDHQKTVEALKRGDQVLTSGGILGTIEGLTEKYATLEISNGVRIKILRSQIAGPAKEST